MICHICDIELFEAKSEQGTRLFFCRNKFCEYFGKSMNVPLNLSEIKNPLKEIEPKVSFPLTNLNLFFGRITSEMKRILN